MTISERIFQILKEREISQASFCKMVGLSGSTVSDWKTKKTNPSADKIMDICNALDITPEQLLTGKGIDDDYTRHTDMEVSFEDKEILVEYHELGEEQQKSFGVSEDSKKAGGFGEYLNLMSIFLTSSALTMSSLQGAK